MFRSLLPRKPFGTIVSSFNQLSERYVNTGYSGTLLGLSHNLSTSLRFTPASYAHRGCIWYDGQNFGSHFHCPVSTKDFLPRYKYKYVNVTPFVISGFLSIEDSAEFSRFVALDIPVWKDRELYNISFHDRDRILRLTLATLVSNQTVQFLSEERIKMPVYKDFPSSLSKREQLLTDQGDVFIVDSINPSWQYWCLAWQP